MTDDSPPASPERVARDGALDRLPFENRAVAAIVTITAVALLARLVVLGYRVMHFDEARVAFWTLRYAETGDWFYRYEIHGPFVQHVTAGLFDLFGTSDFVARLPVALVGGLLPLSVLLFRDYLRDDELVGVALLLAFNPLMLYYSRFFRSDVLVAAFMFVALGYLARTVARGRPTDLYLATAFAALGFASKENALVYVLCWAGMLGAVGGLELLVPRRFESREAFLRAGRQRFVAGTDRLRTPTDRRWAGHVVGGLVLFALVTVFLYAPRNGGVPLWRSTPAGAVSETLAALERGFGFWGEGGSELPACHGLGVGEDTPVLERYRCNLEREVTILTKGAVAVVAMGLVGVVAEQRREVPRLLVTGAFLWAAASLLGYPLATDIAYPAWLATHVVVPLAIPAGVGLALVARWGREALADEETVDAAIAGLLVVVVVAGMVVPAVQASYVAPQSGEQGEAELVQYAQPSGHMQGAVAAMDEAVAANDGVDVVVYGPDFVSETPGAFLPSCLKWLTPMAPVSWYLYRSGADVECASTGGELRTLLDRHDPPVVISSYGDGTVASGELDDRYASTAYGLRLYSGDTNTAVFYFDTERVDWEAPGPGSVR